MFVVVKSDIQVNKHLCKVLHVSSFSKTMYNVHAVSVNILNQKCFQINSINQNEGKVKQRLMFWKHIGLSKQKNSLRPTR